MKIKMIYLLILINTQLIVNCVGQADNFSSFISEFQKCTLPIDSKTYFDSIGIFANNQTNINEFDYNTFLKNKNEKFWQYVLFTNNKVTFYNYVRGCILPMGANFYCILYFRSHFCENPLDEKSELVLCILDNNGNLISDLPIAGNQGEDLSFQCFIENLNYIRITYDQFIDNEKRTYNKFFSVSEEGLILEKQ